MTSPKINTQAPERVWLKPCDPCKAPDDYFVCDPDYLDGRETEYILASLSAAREAAAAMAMREAAAYLCDRMETRTNSPARCAKLIREIPLPDTAALDRLIAERVREARNTAWDEAADIMDGYGQHGYAEEFRARICAARGSKEGRDA